MPVSLPLTHTTAIGYFHVRVWYSLNKTPWLSCAMPSLALLLWNNLTYGEISGVEQLMVKTEAKQMTLLVSFLSTPVLLHICPSRNRNTQEQKHLLFCHTAKTLKLAFDDHEPIIYDLLATRMSSWFKASKICQIISRARNLDYLLWDYD